LHSLDIGVHTVAREGSDRPFLLPTNGSGRKKAVEECQLDRVNKGM
jgi:hypothetical protein